jgi:hypothetical protein
MRNELTDEDRRRAFHVFNLCNAGIPGLFNRSPYWLDHEAFDDYIGLCAASYFVGLSFARDAYNYAQNFPGQWKGIKFRYHFNNREPMKWYWKSWLGRSPSFVAHVKYCAEERPTLFQRTAWRIAILHSMSRPVTDGDSYIMSWLLLQVAGDKGWLNRLVKRTWYKNLYKKFPDGMRDVAKVHFEPGHPFTKYWVD